MRWLELAATDGHVHVGETSRGGLSPCNDSDGFKGEMMGYDLQAIIAREELLRASSQALSEAVVASLEQDLALIPITDAFFDRVTGVPAADDMGFWRLPAGVERTLAAWSVRGPVAYVEAEFFGGVGWQRAAVWSGGVLFLGPLRIEEEERFAAGAARYPRRYAAWARSPQQGRTSSPRSDWGDTVIETTG